MQQPTPPSPTLTFKTFAPSDPIFNLTALPSHKSLNNSIRRQTRTVRNRLHSIHTDSLFITRVAEAYKLPVLTNSRAGDWYVDPARAAGSVYFKSTDGHTGEWGFSLRRLNYQLLEVAGREGGRGAVVVDSTRRGKRFPDALSKTVPIWIAVMNAALFPERGIELHVPPFIPDTEADSIRVRVPGLLKDFLSLGPDLEELRKKVPRPLRPIFVSPDSTLPGEVPVYEEFMPIVCCTASRMVRGEGVEGEYIQGAGDDHEGWSGGLTPQRFWRHADALLATEGDEELEEVLKSLPEDEVVASDLSRIGKTNVYIGPASAVTQLGQDDVLVDCSPTQAAGEECKAKGFHIPTAPTKPGLKALRGSLPKLLEFLAPLVGSAKSIVVVDDGTGDEVAPVVALAVLCSFFGEDGERGGRMVGGKDAVKKRLAWIVTSRESVKPARVGLNAVNEVVLARGSG